jgi:peptidoglycan-associated lipoprotein
MKKLLIALLLIVAVGCAPKKSLKPPEKPAEPEATIKEETMKPEMEEEVVEEMAVPSEDERFKESVMAPEEEAKTVFRDVLFDYDKYNIRADARPVLDDVASFLNRNKTLNIAIEGHCDERGTNEYNLALGEKRAKSTKDYLISLGVSPDRMIIITYGEEKPVCVDQTESCWQKNRRSHFVIVKSRFQ